MRVVRGWGRSRQAQAPPSPALQRNIARDFSDGVLCAEVIRHYFPNLVELHNYSPANSGAPLGGLARVAALGSFPPRSLVCGKTCCSPPRPAVQQKMYNWNTLNTKVFKRLGFSLPRHEMESVANCTQGAVERVLKLIKVKMATYKASLRGTWACCVVEGHRDEFPDYVAVDPHADAQGREGRPGPDGLVGGHAHGDPQRRGPEPWSAARDADLGCATCAPLQRRRGGAGGLGCSLGRVRARWPGDHRRRGAWLRTRGRRVA